MSFIEFILSHFCFKETFNKFFVEVFVLNAFLRKLKQEASLAHLSCSELKLRLGLHSLRRGPVTEAVNAGTSDLHVQKIMRVSSLGMVDYYSVADHQLLLAASKSAF